MSIEYRTVLSLGYLVPMSFQLMYKLNRFAPTANRPVRQFTALSILALTDALY